ncbi:MAG: trypsin-like serine peptidase [Bryobacteraceae bacterium]
MSFHRDAPQSPFLNEEIFSGEPAKEDLGPRASALALESAFAGALEAMEEEVLDKDERTLVADTFKIPNRWICAIDILIDNPEWPKNGPKFISKSRATGTLIGPRYVLTAAHVRDKQSIEIGGKQERVEVKGFAVSPARNGDNSANPFGKVNSKAIQVSQPYRIRRKITVDSRIVEIPVEQRDDYALIILKNDLDLSTHSKMNGALGYWGHTSQKAVIRRMDPTVINGKPVEVTGYAGDRCGKDKISGSTSEKETKIAYCMQRRSDEWASTQWRGRGTLQLDGTSSALFHTADTYDGQSGAPICLSVDGTLNLAGVHTAKNDSRSNKGVRVTRRMLTELCSWMNTDAGYKIATVKNDTLIVRSQSRTAGETAEDFEESEDEPPREFDTPVPSKDVSDAMAAKKWALALQLAIQQGIRDENDLTNLIFFERHRDLGGRALDLSNKEDRKLSEEWKRILKLEVRPAIKKASANVSLQVSGDYVTERDALFAGDNGKKMKELVGWAAKEADINPGFLAAVLLAEWDKSSLYLNPGEVRSFVSGTDDFYDQREQLRKNVPAYSKIRFDEKKISTDTNEHGRVVTTVPFTSGKDAMLATAVYLKYAEIKLRKAAQQNGGDFDAMTIETRFALVRIAMAAGHGFISPDGEFIRIKKVKGKWVRVKKGQTGGTLRGVASRLEKVLKGGDILVRKDEPRRYPSTGHITNRNATILAAQALHLADRFFGVPATAPVPPAPQPETEDEEPAFEMLVPAVSQADLRTRIDEYFNLANASYTLPSGTAVSARPQFRYAKAGGIAAAIQRVSGILGTAFEKSHPKAIYMAAYGRAKPSDIAAITQALIDAGEFPAVQTAHPTLGNEQLVRALQRDFKMGIDCAGYVQLAFIHAYTGSDADPSGVRRRLGLHEKRGWEKLANLSSAHFTKVKLVDAQTGDLFVMKPRAGSADRSWHTVIIVDHTVAGTVHTFLCDASWGTDLYGPAAGGVARRELKHDTSSGEWWDVHPISGADVHKNTTGPYNGHPIHGMFRGKRKK